MADLACVRTSILMHGQVPKNITEASRMADLHGYTEVLYGSVDHISTTLYVTY